MPISLGSGKVGGTKRTPCPALPVFVIFIAFFSNGVLVDSVRLVEMARRYDLRRARVGPGPAGGCWRLLEASGVETRPSVETRLT